MDRQFIYVTKGTRIRPKNKTQMYTYEFYCRKRSGQYMYSYDYQMEEQWLERRPKLDAGELLSGEWCFVETGLPEDGEGYIRLFADAECKAEITAEKFEICTEGFASQEQAEQASMEKRVYTFLERTDVKEEIAHTAQKIAQLLESEKDRNSEKVFLTLLSDTHYVLNGNWEMTAATIEAVNAKVLELTGKKPDAIIHLGDFTDGILSRKICHEYSHKVMERIISWGNPFYIALGNHDANYFRKNSEILNEEAQWEMYLKEIGVKEHELWYTRDIAKRRLRIMMLSAYDNQEELRYGFSLEEIEWVKEELKRLPREYGLLICSHDAPLARLDFWAEEIRNGNLLCEILDEWNAENGNRILGFIHGHTHADFVYQKRSFPIVSVGCSKIEYFEGKKPAGAIAPVRIEGEVTQELWDTLVIDMKTDELDFVRFGAGMDRHVDRTKAKIPAIWAHRGASGHAPENTLEAFGLAEKLGADGIELDVQFTRDREIVVIHDERIDRTSDGHGLVADMTLSELRQYNYNRTVPEFSHCDIPTLREVLEQVKPTTMVINIELKTGVNFYPGLEVATLELVKEYGMEDRVIYSSFNHESILRMKKIAPEAQCGFLYNIGIADVVEYVEKHAVEALHPGMVSIKYPGFVEQCKEKNKKIHVWTVNSEHDLEQMRQYQVDAVITNFPDRARKVYYGEDNAALVMLLKEEMTKKAPDQESVIQLEPEIRSKQEIQPELASVSGTKEVLKKKKSFFLHLAGITYGKVRRPFVALDRFIQEAARK